MRIEDGVAVGRVLVGGRLHRRGNGYCALRVSNWLPERRRVLVRMHDRQVLAMALVVALLDNRRMLEVLLMP